MINSSGFLNLFACFYLCFFLFQPVFGKYQLPDSLQKLVEQYDLENQPRELLRVSEKHWKTNSSYALTLAKHARMMAESLAQHESVLLAYYITGNTHLLNGNNDDAIRNFLLGGAIAESRGLPQHLSSIKNSLGIAYKLKGAYRASMTYLLQALHDSTSRGKPRFHASVLNNIGSVLFLMGQLDEALKINLDGISWCQMYGLRAIEARIHNNMGDIYLKQNAYQQALISYRQSLFLKRKLQLEDETISTLINISMVFKAINNPDSMLKYYQQALSMARGHNNTRWEQQLSEGLGEIHAAQGNYTRSFEYYQESLAHAKEMKAEPSMLNLYRKIGDLYALTNSHENAYDYYRLYDQLKDSLHKQMLDIELEGVEERYEQAYEIQLQLQKIQQMEEEKERTQNQHLTLMLFTLVATAAAFGCFSLYQGKKKIANVLAAKNVAIKNQHELLEHHTKEIAYQNEQLQEQSQKIYTQNQKLKQSNEDLERFAYLASHDLREPLRTIRNYLQLIEKKYGTDLPEDAHEFLSYVVDGAGRMDGMLRDLLDYSRVSKSSPETKVLQLNEVVDAATDNLRQRISSSHAHLRIDSLPKIMGNYPQFVRLFQNLISNAIKFRGDQSPVIEISSQRYENGFLISIKDNGIGIEPRHQSEIFALFKRLHSQEEYPGTGIGLAVCKRIVENHKGKIWLESFPGEGTTFYMYFPATSVTTAEPA